jgi:hypothetical protein
MDNLCNHEKECNSISKILKLQAKTIPKKKLLDKDMFDMSKNTRAVSPFRHLTKKSKGKKGTKKN